MAIKRSSGNKIDDLSRAIGQLEGTVDSVVTAIGSTQKSSADGFVALRDSITALHNELTEIKQAVNSVQAQVSVNMIRFAEVKEEHEEEVTALKREVEKQKTFRLESKTTVYVLRTILVAVAGFFGWLLIKLEGWITTLFHGRS